MCNQNDVNSRYIIGILLYYRSDIFYHLLSKYFKINNN